MMAGDAMKNWNSNEVAKNATNKLRFFMMVRNGPLRAKKD